jgi:hypothetical protein
MISWNLYEIYMTEVIPFSLFIILHYSFLYYHLYLIQIYHFNTQPVDATDLILPTAMSLNSHPYIQVFIFII